MEMRNSLKLFSALIRSFNTLSRSESVNLAIKDSENFSELMGKLVEIGLSRFSDSK